MTISRFRVVLGMLTVLFTMSLYAQTSGEVTGHISDATGAAVPRAKVYLTNTATNAIRQRLSTDSGDYTFAAVAPGVYNMRVEQPSFKTTGSSNIPVQVQQTVRLDFTLEVGSVTDSVEVSASALMLQSENLSLGTTASTTRCSSGLRVQCHESSELEHAEPEHSFGSGAAWPARDGRTC